MNRQFDMLKAEVNILVKAAWVVSVEVPYKIVGNLSGAFDVSNLAGKNISGALGADKMLDANSSKQGETIKDQWAALPPSTTGEKAISAASLMTAPLVKGLGATTEVVAGRMFESGSAKASTYLGSLDFSENMSQIAQGFESLFKGNDILGAIQGVLDSAQSQSKPENAKL